MTSYYTFQRENDAFITSTAKLEEHYLMLMDYTQTTPDTYIRIWPPDMQLITVAFER